MPPLNSRPRSQPAQSPLPTPSRPAASRFPPLCPVAPRHPLCRPRAGACALLTTVSRPWYLLGVCVQGCRNNRPLLHGPPSPPRPPIPALRRGRSKRQQEAAAGAGSGREEQRGEGLSFKPQRLPSFWSGPLASRAPSSCLQGPPGTTPRARTCGSHSSEVVGPAQHHAGPVAGALNQGPGQGREQEDHGQVQHGHEEGEVEALHGAQAQSTDGGAVTACRRPPGSCLPPRLYLVEGRCFSSSRGRRSVRGALGTPRLPSSSSVSPPLLISPPSLYLRGIPGVALSRRWCEWLPV